MSCIWLRLCPPVRQTSQVQTKEVWGGSLVLWFPFPSFPSTDFSQIGTAWAWSAPNLMTNFLSTHPLRYIFCRSSGNLSLSGIISDRGVGPVVPSLGRWGTNTECARNARKHVRKHDIIFQKLNIRKNMRMYDIPYRIKCEVHGTSSNRWLKNNCPNWRLHTEFLEGCRAVAISAAGAAVTAPLFNDDVRHMRILCDSHRPGQSKQLLMGRVLKFLVLHVPMPNQIQVNICPWPVALGVLLKVPTGITNNDD